MKDWKKAVLGSAIAFCLILAILGIFSLIGAVHMTAQKIRVASISVDDTFQREMLIASSCALVLCAVCFIVLVFCVISLFLSETTKLRVKGVATVCTIVIAVVSVAFFITALCLRTRVPHIDSYNMNFIDYNYLLYYQTMLSAVFSGFIPLLIGAVLLLCCRFCKVKKLESTTIGEADEKTAESTEE